MWLSFVISDVVEYSEGTLKSNVTVLGFTHAGKKLVYGDANTDLQCGLLWLLPNLAA